MALIIFSIVAMIITIIAMAIEEDTRPFCWIGLLWLLLILFGCFTTIGANTVAVMYNPFRGGIQNEVLNEGFKGKSPFDKVYKISTEVKEFTFENLSVQTSDSQFVNATMQLQVRIDKSQAFEYFKKYGGKDLDDIQTIISNTTQQKLEQVTTKYNIMEMLGEKRNDIVNETLELIKEELMKDGILVERIVLVDTDAGEAIEGAIANEAVKKKEAESAEYERQKAQLEGEAKVIQAQKDKEANDLKQTSLTPAVLQEKMIEKWNGQLPNTVLNDNIMSIFNAGGNQ